MGNGLKYSNNFLHRSRLNADPWKTFSVWAGWQPSLPYTVKNLGGGGLEAIGLGTLGPEDIRRDDNRGEETTQDNKRDNTGERRQ